MFRTTDIVFTAAIVAAAAFTYTTKHQVEAQRAEVRRIEARIKFEQDTISILKADWSLLTQPARLQRLAERYQDELQLTPLEARQIANAGDLPARPVEIEDLLARPAEGMAQGGTDRTTTSGVVR
ncbi:MAG: hypothetical protein WBA44_07495 [Mesorhizobium sp.]